MSKKEMNELSLDDLEQASGGVIETKKEIVESRYGPDLIKTTYVVKDDSGKVWGEYGSSLRAEGANDMLKKMGKTTK